jgi:serine/threonine protein kinase
VLPYDLSRRGERLLEPGIVVAGRYRLTRLIGRGGMGAVWSAVDDSAARSVAIKTLVHLPAEGSDAAARLRREARAAARIDHPAVVEIFDAGVLDDGRPFIVMELIDGPSLLEAIGGRGLLALPVTLALLDRLLDVLEAAHLRDVVHRDLKPENIIISRAPRGRDDALRVLDFGISHLEDGLESMLTRRGAMLGTPCYMSPEQARGEAVDARADVYSIGAIAYELVSGLRPYAEHRGIDVLSAMMRGPPIPLATQRPSLPSQLVAWIEHAMERRTVDRFPSAAAARRALRETMRELSLSSEVEAVDLAAILGRGDEALDETLPLGFPSNARIGLEQSGERRSSQSTLPPARATHVPPTPLPPSPFGPRAIALAMLGGLVLGAVNAALTMRAQLASFSAESLVSIHGAGSIVGALLVALAWLLVAIAAPWARTPESARSIAVLGTSQCIYHGYLALFGAAPRLASHPLLATLGHGASLGGVACLPLAYALIGARSPGVRVFLRLNAVGAGIVACFAGTRWWLAQEADGLRAGPLLVGVGIYGTLVALFAAGLLLRGARTIADVDHRGRVRATAAGVGLGGLLLVGNVLAYLGSGRPFFSMLALLPIGLVAYGVIGVDRVIATRARGRADTIAYAQSAAAFVLATFVSVATVMIARSWSSDAQLGLILPPLVSAALCVGMALRLLTLEEPTERTVLLGALMTPFAALQMSILYVVFRPSAAEGLGLSRAAHALFQANTYLWIALTRRLTGRTSERWIEWAAAAVSLIFMPIALSDAYFSGSRRYWFGDFAQASWAFAVYAVVVLAFLGYGLLIAIDGARRAREDARLGRALLPLMLLFLAAITYGDVRAVCGHESYPTSNFSFIPLSLIAWLVLRDELPEVRASLAADVIRPLSSLAVATLSAALVVVVARVGGQRSPWAGALATTLVLVLAIEPLRAVLRSSLDRWLGRDKLDERNVLAALIRIADRVRGHEDLERRARTVLARELGVEELLLLFATPSGGYARGACEITASATWLAELRQSHRPLRIRRRDARSVPAELAPVLGDVDELIVVPCLHAGRIVALAVVVPGPGAPLQGQRALRLLGTVGETLALLADLARDEQRAPAARTSVAGAEAARPSAKRA